MAGKTATPVDAMVGQNIRLHRERCGLTQTDLGRRVGVTKQQIQKYELGVNRLSPDRLNQIALVLGVPLVTLFEGNPVNTAADDERVRSLLASPYSVRLVQAFDTVKRESVRIAILELIEAIVTARGSSE